MRSEGEEQAVSGRGRCGIRAIYLWFGYSRAAPRLARLVMRNHKSLLAWQEAHAVVVTVLPAIRQVNHWFSNPVFDQLQRAALSVQLNIAEGYALRTSKRFRNHLDIAYGSAVETAELLELCRELGLLTGEFTTSALERCQLCQRLLRGLINYLSKR